VTEPQLDAMCRRWRKDGIAWPERDPERIRPASGSTCNRYLATLRRAYNLGRRKFRLVAPLTFPHFEERSRGEYLSEDDCRRICQQFRAKVGARVKADVFRLGYLLGIRKGQLRGTRRSNVVILGRRGKVNRAPQRPRRRRLEALLDRRADQERRSARGRAPRRGA
jgi:integrase